MPLAVLEALMYTMGRGAESRSVRWAQRRPYRAPI
eukprot:SAG31_NODE_25871_length_452_cov_1.161473_1_plen_34_part_10